MPIDERWQRLEPLDWEAFARALLGEPRGASEAPESSVGQSVVMMNGTASPEQHESEVVVVDFWATWCPPCVEGLPKVAGIAQELKGEGVVFYAVNLREDEETIREFLDKQELSVPVLLDKEEVADLYQADAIPQTVLIGKDGRIQAVHTGFSAGTETQLREELQALVEGEDVASKARAEAAEEKPSDAAFQRDTGERAVKAEPDVQ